MNNEQINEQATSEQPNEQSISEQNQIRREKLAALQAEGRDPFRHVTYPVTTHSKDVHGDFDALEGKEVAIAGRVTAKRIMGKAAFMHIQDKNGQVQIYVKRDEIGEDAYNDFKQIDIGDIVGSKGIVFRTKTGEASVHAAEVVLLAKSLQVPPEKWHGLKDKEARYRQRYLDLTVNPDVRETFIKRTATVKAIRAFLDGRDYLEVDTHILQVIPGGGSARPFLTKHNAMDMEMYMRIALELPLKQLIIGGLERVYEMGRCFRNEGISTRHNPEFLMLELYEAYTDYHGMMELIESMLREVSAKVNGSQQVECDGTIIDFSKPFERITMADAVLKYAGVDFNKITTTEEARAAAKEKNVHFEPRHGKGKILENFFDEYVEKNLIQPTFILDHPVEISPLTKRKPDNPDFTERFELFITGKEFANAYSELNDPIDQRARFMHQEEMRQAGDEEATMIDEDFLLSMEYGMPPTGGLGLGVERLVMLLTGAASIRDVIFFPTMRPNL